MERRLAGGDSVRRHCRSSTGAYSLAGGLRRRVVLPDRAGLQGHRRRRHAGQLLRSAAVESRHRHGVATAPDRRRWPTSERATRRAPTTSATTGARTPPSTTRTSTICSARPRSAARATTRSSAASSTLIFDEPRRLDLDLERRHRGQPRSAAGVSRTCPSTSIGCTRSRPGCQYSDVRKSLGAVDDETGTRWTVRRRRASSMARSCRGARPPTIAASRCPAGHSSIWLRRPRPGSRRAIATSRSPTSSSAGSATTTSITATRNATASTYSFPAPSSTKSAAAIS